MADGKKLSRGDRDQMRRLTRLARQEIRTWTGTFLLLLHYSGFIGFNLRKTFKLN